MALKFIPLEATGTYQNFNVRVIDDPETIDFTDTPTFNMPTGLSQTGNDANGNLTGSSKSLLFDGFDDYVQLPASGGSRSGLNTHITLENIGGSFVGGKPTHGISANNVHIDVWLKLSETGSNLSDARFFDMTLQRDQATSTTGFDGVYTGRVIYTNWPGRGSTSAHFIELQYASSDVMAYSVTSLNPLESTTGDWSGSPSGGVTGWNHVSCVYQAGRAPQNGGDNSSSTGDSYFQIFINGNKDREVSTFVLENDLVGLNQNYPATASPLMASNGISFNGRLDELRLMTATGVDAAYIELSKVENIGLATDDYAAATVVDNFSPSSDHVIAWWRFDSTSAIDLFASVEESIEDYTQYNHDGTPVNFTGSVDFTEDEVVVMGLSASGDIHSLSGGTVDHGGIIFLYPNNNTIRLEEGNRNIIKEASNSWVTTGNATVTVESTNIFFGSSGVRINTNVADAGASHTINYTDEIYDKNDYTLNVRILSLSGSVSARVSFTLGDTLNTKSTTAVMRSGVWEPVVLRHKCINTTAGLTGRVDVVSIGGESLLLLDALHIHQGTAPITSIAPDRIRYGGEVSWAIRD